MGKQRRTQEEAGAKGAGKGGTGSGTLPSAQETNQEGRSMDKRSAMEMVNEHLGNRLLYRENTSFANINASKPVWWININPSKFKSDLHLLLAKEGYGGLIWLHIKGNAFPDVRKVFRVRQDKDCIDLEISSRPPKYMTDIKSGGTEYDFTKHIAGFLLHPRSAVAALNDELRAAEGHIRDCQGAGCGATCGCPCHAGELRG